MDSVALQDVAVDFTLEEWTLLDPSQKTLYKEVMLDTLQNLASIGEKWEDQNIKYRFKSQGDCLSTFMVEKDCGHQDSNPSSQTLSQIPSVNLNRKTTRRKQCECRACGIVPVHHSACIRHIRSHTKHKLCDYRESRECKNRGGAPPFLQASRKHEGPRPGKKHCECKQCGKTFVATKLFQKHQSRHAGGKRCECGSCGRASRGPKSLQIHEETHSGKKPYPCKECGKASMSLRCFQRHMITHSEDPPHQCDTYGKGFVSPSTLRRHEVLHTAEKPFACKQCGKTQGCRPAIRAQERSRSGVRPCTRKECVQSPQFPSRA